jgi:hypothetical protein
MVSPLMTAFRHIRTCQQRTPKVQVQENHFSDFLVKVCLACHARPRNPARAGGGETDGSVIRSTTLPLAASCALERTGFQCASFPIRYSNTPDLAQEREVGRGSSNHELGHCRRCVFGCARHARKPNVSVASGVPPPASRPPPTAVDGQEYAGERTLVIWASLAEFKGRPSLNSVIACRNRPRPVRRRPCFCGTRGQRHVW